MKYYLVEDGNGDYIGRYQRNSPPSEPEEYTGKWDVTEVSKSVVENAEVNWWGE